MLVGSIGDQQIHSFQLDEAKDWIQFLRFLVFIDASQAGSGWREKGKTCSKGHKVRIQTGIIVQFPETTFFVPFLIQILNKKQRLLNIWSPLMGPRLDFPGQLHADHWSDLDQKVEPIWILDVRRDPFGLANVCCMQTTQWASY